MSSSHYAHPEAYAALLDPDADELARIQTLISPWLGEVGSVLDPACGPAGYLLPWAERGCHVAGNDLEPAMLAFARQRLQAFEPVELTLGDMAELDLAHQAFDLALNLNMSIGHLPDDDRVRAHLQAVRRHLRPGGLYLVALTVLGGELRERRPEVVFRSSWRTLASGGQAAIAYTSVERDPRRRRERIEVTLRLRRDEAAVPDVIVERYALHTFTPEALDTLCAEADLELVNCCTSDGARWDPVDLDDDEVDGDVVVVLRAH